MRTIYDLGNRPARNVHTEELLRGLAERLPEEVRRELAKGPLPEPKCRVCDVLRPKRDEASAALLSWKCTPLHTPEGDREAYARCLAIYRAAGWEGEEIPLEDEGVAA
jgi:hypothetical protein